MAPDAALDLCRERLQWAAASYGGSDLGFVVEAINQVDMPGYLLSTPETAAALVEDVASPWVGLQFDAYHAGMIGRELREALAAQLPLIRHVQLADAPGRHEPGTGRLDLTGLLHDLDAGGYDGWVGCEYRPTKATEATLGWMRRT
jgi:hydroxypyruvate isomerase